MCQQESVEENKLLLEKLSFVLFADSDWKPFALLAEKLAPSLSQLLLRVQKKLGVELFSERFLTFLTTLLVNDLFYLFFFFRCCSKKISRRILSRSVVKCALYVFKITSLKEFFLQNLLRFFNRFQTLSETFLDFRQKNCALIVKTTLHVFRRSSWRKQFDFFPFFFRIQQNDFRLPSKTLGSVFVTSFCLSRGEFQWKLCFFFEKSSFSPKSVFCEFFLTLAKKCAQKCQHCILFVQTKIFVEFFCEVKTVFFVLGLWAIFIGVWR